MTLTTSDTVPTRVFMRDASDEMKARHPASVRATPRVHVLPYQRPASHPATQQATQPPSQQASRPASPS